MNATSALLDPVTALDHSRGAVHGRITIVEYGDFECPVCRAVEPGVRMVLERAPNDIRLIYRHLPIESAHPHALVAAEAAEAAAAQGKFWEMHDRLLTVGLRLDRRTIDRQAAELGLNMPQFIAALDDEIYRQRVREQMEGAFRAHLRATPGFYVNGHLCDVSGGIHSLGERVGALL